MLHHDYDQTYDPQFFRRADGAAHWRLRKLRYGDALAAIGYALGMEGFDRLQKWFRFEGLGKGENDGPLGYEARLQLDILKRSVVDAGTARKCQYILDVGGGRGEVALSLAWLGKDVQVVEPHAHAYAWMIATHTLFFPDSPLKVQLINSPVPECLDCLDLAKVDTVLFVESLEHIPQDCFDLFWPKVKVALMRNKGRLVVANWIDYHPLPADNREHCRRVDDVVYDELARGGAVKHRNGSHLVVDY